MDEIELLVEDYVNMPLKASTTGSMAAGKIGPNFYSSKNFLFICTSTFIA